MNYYLCIVIWGWVILMSKLYDYYGMDINLLCKAVMNSNEQLVDKLLADESFSEINDGVSPLYFLEYIGIRNLDNAKRDKILRIFRKILNNERFTNVNTIFYDGYYSSTLLSHLLYQDDPVFETCCVELINSPKYQLIDYPGNYGDYPNSLNIAVIQEKRLAAKAIMDHPDFTKIDFSFGGLDFVRKCKELYKNGNLQDEEIRKALQLIMNEYVLRECYQCYNATDTDIAKRITNAIQALRPYVSKCHLFPPMSAACNITRTDNSMIYEILNHPKFTRKMLSRHIKNIARQLTDEEAYATFSQNNKIEGWTPEFYGELAYYLINIGKIGLLKALLENENICLSEQFYSYYKYFLKNAIKASEQRNSVLVCPGYNKYEGNEICRIVDEKYKKQEARHQLDSSKFVELKNEDYSILRMGMDLFYGLVSRNGNESSEQDKLDESLGNILKYDKQNDKIGPFFNISDRDKVWKLFSEYESFDEFRQMFSTSAKVAKRYVKM